MTFDELITIADKNYPDGLVLAAHENRDDDDNVQDVGDTLAMFIVRELQDVHSDKAPRVENLAEAVRVMRKAAAELEAVAKALASA